MADLSKLREALAELELAHRVLKSSACTAMDRGDHLQAVNRVIAAAREVAAQADAQPAVAAVPEGWVMVPKVATPEMRERGSQASVEGLGDLESAEVWAAMLSAAPAAPQVAPEAEDFHCGDKSCDCWGTCQRAALRAAPAAPASEGVASAYTTGHCEHRRRWSGCPFPNLQCGWPDCDRKAAAKPGEMPRG